MRATRLRPGAKGVDAFAPDPVGHLVKENDVETVEGIAQHTLALPETEVLAPRPLSLSSGGLAATGSAGLVPAAGHPRVPLALVPISSQFRAGTQQPINDCSPIRPISCRRGCRAMALGANTVAAVLLGRDWNERASALRAATWVAVALSGTAVLVGEGTVVQAVRVGHLGNRSRVPGRGHRHPSAS